MKPLEAAEYLRQVSRVVSASPALPPHIRLWFYGGVKATLETKGVWLDSALGLRSRIGGRAGGIHNTTPDRDLSLRLLARSLSMSTDTARAQEIVRLSKAGELRHIQALGRIPGYRQLLRIIRNDN